MGASTYMLWVKGERDLEIVVGEGRLNEQAS